MHIDILNGKKTDDQIATEAMLPSGDQQQAEYSNQRNLDRIKALVCDCIEKAKNYRELFKKDWDEVERQVRQQAPPEWDKKEAWQSKIYIGLQTKASESAFSSLRAMLFPTDRFFESSGVEKEDREKETSLEELIQTTLDQGGFYEEKDFWLQEGIDIGTSFIKLLVRPDMMGIDYAWRTAYQTLVDPAGYHNWKNCKFWIDQYPKDASWLLEQIALGEKSIYDQALLAEAWEAIKSKQENPDSRTAIEQVKTIDGTANFPIPEAYKTFTLNEFWGFLPEFLDPNDESKGYILKLYLVSMVNEEFIIRATSDTPFGFIPAVPLRTKRRKYDFYGKGYLLDGRGIQDLTNSMVNLGFDSQKISAMDIIILDENKIADKSSIEYRPLAVWKVKGNPRDAALLTRSGVSAMGDLLNGITLLDRMHQDTVGVTRNSEGTPAIDGKQGEKTLGEYQLKVQAVDKRFMSEATRIENESLSMIIEYTYEILRNPKLISQQYFDRVLGFQDIVVQDPATGQSINMGKMPKLLQQSLNLDGSMKQDFRCFGVTQFSERQRKIQALKEALQGALGHPFLAALTNIDVIWKKLFQISEVPDWEEIIKNNDQIKQVMGMLQQMAGQQMVQPQQPQESQSDPSKAY